MAHTVQSFFDRPTGSWSYVLTDMATKQAAIIDPVLNFEHNGATVSTQTADAIMAYVQANALTVVWLLETHVHADHVTASDYLQSRLGGKKGISRGILPVIKFWKPVYQLKDLSEEGAHFDQLFDDNDVIALGETTITVLQTPGHTPTCVIYYIDGQAAFMGDTLFEASRGTARVDFPGGSGEQLYQSIQKIYAMPDEVTLYLCHDYPSNDDQPIEHCKVSEQKAHNMMCDAGVTQAHFLEKRQARDAKLPVPKLILFALFFNLQAGVMPEKDRSGYAHVTLPINFFSK